MRVQTAKAKRVQNPESGAHSSVVGGSTAKIRLKCSMSRVQEAKVPKETSIYADRGTALHHIVEWSLRNDKSDAEVAQEWLGSAVKHGDMAFTIDITAPLLEGKVFPALAFVDELPEDAVIYTERKVSFRANKASVLESFEEIEGAFGTADITFVGENSAGVADFKFGDGRIVKADDNDQGRFYLVGAIMNGVLPIRDEYEFWIFQPAESLDTNEYASKGVYTLEELIQFNNDLAAAIAEEPRFNPGPHCADCKGKIVCPRYQDFIAGIVESDVQGVSTAQLGEWMDMVASVRKWADDVERTALRNAETGRPVPGYATEVALGRSDWRDPDKAAGALSRLSVPAKDRNKTALVSPAQALKLLKKAGASATEIERFEATHIYRPNRGMKLVKLKPGEGSKDNMAVMAEVMKARGL